MTKIEQRILNIEEFILYGVLSILILEIGLWIVSFAPEQRALSVLWTIILFIFAAAFGLSFGAGLESFVRVISIPSGHLVHFLTKKRNLKILFIIIAGSTVLSIGITYYRDTLTFWSTMIGFLIGLIKSYKSFSKFLEKK